MHGLPACPASVQRGARRTLALRVRGGAPRDGGRLRCPAGAGPRGQRLAPGAERGARGPRHASGRVPELPPPRQRSCCPRDCCLCRELQGRLRRGPRQHQHPPRGAHPAPARRRAVGRREEPEEPHLPHGPLPGRLRRLPRVPEHDQRGGAQEAHPPGGPLREPRRSGAESGAGPELQRAGALVGGRALAHHRVPGCPQHDQHATSPHCRQAVSREEVPLPGRRPEPCDQMCFGHREPCLAYSHAWVVDLGQDSVFYSLERDCQRC
mmetsp:Transcript_120808/g.352897  ORF Transcript_120808/g.352897 Transcript_120808/m.352897 type:complete len:266 (+) Transcript_120808:110-907(+)